MCEIQIELYFNNGDNLCKLCVRKEERRKGNFIPLWSNNTAGKITSLIMILASSTLFCCPCRGHSNLRELYVLHYKYHCKYLPNSLATNPAVVIVTKASQIPLPQPLMKLLGISSFSAPPSWNKICDKWLLNVELSSCRTNLALAHIWYQ